jgi:hypothetical protein
MYGLAVVSKAGEPECHLPQWVASIRDVYVLGANWRPFKVQPSQASNQVGFYMLAYEGVRATSRGGLLKASAMLHEPRT